MQVKNQEEAVVTEGGNDGGGENEGIKLKLVRNKSMACVQIICMRAFIFYSYKIYVLIKYTKYILSHS